jgi:hypothetical protein
MRLALWGNFCGYLDMHTEDALFEFVGLEIVGVADVAFDAGSAGFC